MDIFELSPREFRAFLEEERQYRTPEQIDDLMRRYNQANSLSGRLSGLLAPQEGRRRTTFFPASVPEGMSLFDAVRSGEADFAVPQGIVDMVVGGVQGVENPGLAAQGRIPAADMETAALQTAGTAMAGGGVAAGRGILDYDPTTTRIFAGPKAKTAEDVSARGDQILNMLKSGRGSEVTDAMLDMGDSVKNTQLNQYLAANYDLPMDEASRLARAREMGFEGGLFHGTDADIMALDKAKFGLGENLLGKGFYTTGNPKRANIYVPIGNPKLPKGVFQTGNSDFTQGGNILPLMTRSATEFDATQSTGKSNALSIGKAFEGSDFDVEIRDNGDQVFIKSKTNPDLSVYIDSYQDGMVTLQKLKDVFGRENVTNILEEAGFSGLKAPESSGSVTRVNYNPQDVRTQFARFDPRLSHLSNVTAANASPISGLLAQSGVSSEQAQRIEDYLYRTGLLQ